MKLKLVYDYISFVKDERGYKVKSKYTYAGNPLGYIVKYGLYGGTWHFNPMLSYFSSVDLKIIAAFINQLKTYDRKYPQKSIENKGGKI